MIAACIIHPDECAVSNAVTVWIKCKSHQCGPDNVHYRGNCMIGSVLSYTSLMSLCLCVVHAQVNFVYLNRQQRRHEGRYRSPTGQSMHTCPVNVLSPSEVAMSRQAHLKESCEFRVPEGNMGGVGVGPSVDTHP